jgi:hypothetical protein
VSALLSKKENAVFILCYQSRATITDEYLLEQSKEFGFEHEFSVLEVIFPSLPPLFFYFIIA